MKAFSCKTLNGCVPIEELMEQREAQIYLIEKAAVADKFTLLLSEKLYFDFRQENQIGIIRVCNIYTK